MMLLISIFMVSCKEKNQQNESMVTEEGEMTQTSERDANAILNEEERNALSPDDVVKE